MIATLRGRVLERGNGRIVLDVQGVGYLLSATSSAVRLALPDGEEVTLVTHLHVREDALMLYGFASTAERDLFELLLGVSGVGPKAALAIVSGYAPDQIRRAILTADHALFTSISGIGRKTAERVVIDLKDKVGALPADEGEAAPAAAPAMDDHTAARDALVNLGMSVAEAEAALRGIDEELPVGERIRLAL
ncbi:MAG TPA: Holliday junction branch migration protein RuvA, partial [Gaiellales bacterium]|nr:Holliday junction branch migration protein RuvA [Gaiellales bacterium]